MFHFCPSCASQEIRFENDRVFRCKNCGFTYYHNIAAATACIIRGMRGLLFVVRGKDPGKGKLDLAGGFVDPGEGAVEGLLRELKEELGWTPPPGDEKCRPRFFASYPNKYPYKGIMYNTCDLFFTIDAPRLTVADLVREESELSELRFIPPDEIRLDEIAFESARRAVQQYCKEQ